jgi:hypothetical protein
MDYFYPLNLSLCQHIKNPFYWRGWRSAPAFSGWDAIPAQLIHFAFLVVLLIFVDRYDSWSLDLALRRGNVNV